MYGRSGVFLIVVFALGLDLVAFPQSTPKPHSGERIPIEQLGTEQKAKMKQAPEAVRTRMASMSKKVMADAEEARLAFIRQHQQKLVAENEKTRMRIAQLKQREAKLSPERKRIGEIKREAGELLIRYRTADTKDREQIDKRAATLVEELNRIGLSTPASKREK